MVLENQFGKYSPFITKLHEEDFFDLQLFNDYLVICETLNSADCVNKTEFKTIISDIIDIFEYTLMRLFYHLDTNDLSQISNYQEIALDIPDIEMNIRATTKKLILKF